MGKMVSPIQMMILVMLLESEIIDIVIDGLFYAICKKQKNIFKCMC